MPDHSSLKILCLDAGDARCMSQLYILQEYMNRLEYKIGKSILPCDHFDLTAAVDTSSPIAIFLCLFRMSAEDAQAAFHGLYTAVFANENDSPETRAVNLEDEVKRLLDLHGIPHTKRLSEFSSTNASKLALCYSPTARMDSCNFFRTYRSGHQITQDITIIEAIQTTWATLGVLPAVHIGPKGREETIASAANGFANPIREVIKEAYNAFGADSKVSCVLSLGSGFRGILAVDGGGSISLGAGTDCDRVAQDVKRVLARFNVYYRLSVDRGLEGRGAYTAGFGTIKAHVNEYLGRDEPDNELNRCISSSLTGGTISLERIHGAKAQGPRSGYGLPPLSAYFVMRRKPMDAIVKALIEGDEFTQRIMVISGLGGSGKTQLVLKFARDFQDSYGHVLFIDASSADSIEKGLIARVRPMRMNHPPSTYEEALDILCNPDEEGGKDWFIIFDNADNAEIPLSNYIPSCEHGSILITTRNSAVGNLAPDSHLELGSMDEAEAVEVILSSAFPAFKGVTKHGPSEKRTAAPLPTSRDRDTAITIANELGCLPIAVVQAGCYIKQHRALHSYLDRLKSNRLDLLKRSTTVHRDRLRYSHGVYASFDIILQSISARALGLLGILSFFHYSNFPKPLFAIAAHSTFAREEIELFDRPPEFQRSIQSLLDIICPNGVWSETELDGLLEELQKYSLVTLVPIHNIVAIRFHPLVHSWAQDRLTAEERTTFRAAAVRLFVCGIVDGGEHGIWEYLEPHTPSFSLTISDLHINDQAAILRVLRWDRQTDICLATWSSIYKAVELHYGQQNQRTNRALLMLADAHGGCGDRLKMESLERESVSRNESLLGEDHLETAKARENLSRTLAGNGAHLEAEELQKKVLHVRIRVLGLHHTDTAEAMMLLGKTYCNMGLHQDAQNLIAGVIAIRSKIIGSAASGTLRSLDYLAECHYGVGQVVEAEKLRKQALLLGQELHGEQHLSTVASMRSLAEQYEDQGQYQEAEALRRTEVETLKRVQGDRHEDTLDAIGALANACYELKRYQEAEDLWREEVEGLRATREQNHHSISGPLSQLAQVCFSTKKYGDAEMIYTEVLSSLRVNFGNSDIGTLNSMMNLAYLYFKLGRYQEAEELWREELIGRRKTQGDTHRDTLLTIYWLAKSCFALKRYHEAEKLWREELDGRRLTHEDTHADVLSTIHSIGKAYFELEWYSDAEALWRDVLAGRRATLEKNHRSILSSICYLGRVCFHMEKYDEAEKLYIEALAGLRTTKGSLHAETLSAVIALTELYLTTKQYKDAEQLREELLACGRASLGNYDLEILIKIGAMARLYYDAERYHEAEELWREELVGRRVLHPENDRYILDILGWVAQSCFDLEQYEESEKLRREELRGRRVTQGDTHADTLRVMGWLARTYFMLERYEDSEELYRERLICQRMTQGDNHLNTLGVLYRLAEICFKLERYEEARKFWSEDLAGRRVALGDTHGSTLCTMGWLGRACFELKRYEEAELLWRENAVGYTEILGDSHELTLAVISWISQACMALRRYEEAETMKRKVLATLRVTQGDTHDDTLKAIYRLGELCFELRRYEEAEKLWREALAGHRETQGDTHSDTLEAISHLSRVCVKVGGHSEAELLLKEILEALKKPHNRIPAPSQDHLLLARTFHMLAQVYRSTGRYSEATDAINEAIRLRRENPKPDDPELLESLGLLQSILIDIKPQIDNVQTSLDQRDLDGVSPEALSAPDPGGDPTYSPPSSPTTPGLVYTRHQSPFSLRTAFFNRPNSWSMF